LATSSATDLLGTIAAAAAAESPLWGEALRADPEREPVFGALVRAELALGVETIYEGYLVHYGRSRLFAAADDDVALLLGDYLYAHGLVRVAETGDLDAVAALAELISTCAALRAEEAPGDAEAWLALAKALAPGDTMLQGASERVLAAHARLLG
jgi:hypothetical protein